MLMFREVIRYAHVIVMIVGKKNYDMALENINVVTFSLKNIIVHVHFILYGLHFMAKLLIVHWIRVLLAGTTTHGVGLPIAGISRLSKPPKVRHGQSTRISSYMHRPW